MRPRESFVGQPIRSLQTMLRMIAIDKICVPFCDTSAEYKDRNRRRKHNYRI